MDHSNDDGDTPIVIKRRKIDDKEQIEAEHTIDGCSLSSLASSYSSGGFGSSNEEASKVESEFDLMKSMLREGSRRKSKKLGVGRAVNKESIELEVVHKRV